MLRGSAVAIVVATFIAAGAVGATAIRGRGESHQDSNSAAGSAAPTSAAPASVAPSNVPANPTATPTATPTVDTTPAHPDPTPVSTPVDSIARGGPRTAVPSPSNRAERARPSITPSLPVGQSTLAAGVTAVRADSEVTVAFDTPDTRTRRPEKFERFVRTTLPMVYGASVRDLLATVPEGTLAAQGDLITELPSRGLRIPVDSAWTIRVFPETRAGQDGPLVVRYRVFVAPARP